MKHKCIECDKIATWLYLSCSEEKYIGQFYCDDCVRRACYCNLIDLEDVVNDSFEQYKDNLGRYLPCSKSTESKNGFEIE